MDNIQRTLCTIPKVYCFKCPPLKGGQGYKAKEWDQTPIWVGRLRIVAQGKHCAINLEHADKPGLFATCPVKSTKTVEQVTDSSRYFVLRIQSAGGLAANVGIGFDERIQAFDFKASIQDFQTQESADKRMAKLDNSIKLNADLPANGKIKVKLAGKLKAKKIEKKEGAGEEDGSDPFSFSPPPSSTGKPKSKKIKKEKKKKKKKHKSKELFQDDGDEEKSSSSKTSGGTSEPQVEDILGFGNLSIDQKPKPSKNKNKNSEWEAF